MSRNPYVEFWYVASFSDPNKTYKVSKKADGTYACSCPHWLYRRPPDGCKHIQYVLTGAVVAVQVQNTFMVKMLGTLSEWCERIDAGEHFTPDFDDLWRETKEQQAFLTPVEYSQLEGELLATENFWRRHQ